MMYLLVILGLISTAVAVPSCNKTIADECIKPASDYFFQRYEELKKAPFTSEKWKKDLTTQCELDQSGRLCLIEYGKRCFPKQAQPNLLLNETRKDFCALKVENITTGCPPDSSTWYAKCEKPLLDRLHLFLTTKNEKLFKIEPAKFVVVHKQLCCELKSYEDCLIPTSTAKCSAAATEIFQAIVTDSFLAYNCHPQVLAQC